MKYNFVHPKKFDGFLVIEDDDGPANTQNRWDFIKEYFGIQKSRFAPFNDAMSYAPCVNASSIGQPGKLTIEQLQVMEKEGAEIVNHGNYHASFNAHPIVFNVSAGSTTLVANSVRPGNFEFLETEIFDNDKSEVLDIVSVTTDSEENTTTFTLGSPLSNGYSSSDAQVRLTANGIDEEVNGGRAILESWGLDVRHYVNAYHHSSQMSQSIISEEHHTARQARGVHSFPVDPSLDYNMRSWTWSDFDADREEKTSDIKQNRLLAQIYAHGGGARHESMRGIIKKNIRVINKREMYKLMVNDRESRVE